MANSIHRLTDRQVRTIKKPGRHADGGGLYLVVDPPRTANGQDTAPRPGARRWVWMSWRGGRQVEIGLGGVTDVTLAAARERAAVCRQAVAEGREPRAVLAAKPKPDVDRSFGAVADAYIETHKSGWRNDKHAAQWQMTMKVYAAPLRSKDVADITVDDVLGVLKPIWLTKSETASRVRGRIESVLDAAKAQGLRSGENPAAWRGNLKHLLPKRQKLSRGHHAAMPWRDVPAFVAQLRALPSMSALCLEFVILTAARQGEVVRSVRGGVVHGMRWDEIDTQTQLWTVPAIRMKTGVPHSVPLSTRALEILAEVGQAKRGPFVFTGVQSSQPLSEMALTMCLRGILGTKVGARHCTVHGFRSSFRDWVGDQTNYPRELAEMALSHALESDVEAAYRRETAIEKRRELMEAWARFVSGEEVTRLAAPAHRSPG